MTCSPTRRSGARFDRGEIDAEGHEVPPERPFYRDFQQGAGQERYQTNGGFTQEDIEAFFSQAFSQGGGGAEQAGPVRVSPPGVAMCTTV